MGGNGQVTAGGERDVLGDLEAEEDRLAGILVGLAEARWRLASAADGWSVADVLLHLAQSEELVVASVTGRAGPGLGNAGYGMGGTVDDVAERLVRFERAEPAAVLGRWESARRAALEVLHAADPAQHVPWVARPLRPRTLATTRLAEHWAHGLDITAPLGIVLEDTPRLWHVAWLGHRSLAYAFELAGDPPPDVRCELESPDGATWCFGAPDAETLVSGPAGDFCRVGARRLSPERSALRAEGPHGAEVLARLRNYAA